MKSEQLDAVFGSGEDQLPPLDLSTLRRPNLPQSPVVSTAEDGEACPGWELGLNALGLF